MLQQKVVNHPDKKEPSFQDFTRHVDNVVFLGTTFFGMLQQFGNLMSSFTKSSLGIDRRSSQTLPLRKTEGIDIIDGRYFRRKIKDAENLFEFINSGMRTVQITNIPFESTRSGKKHHPQGDIISQNVVTVLDKFLRAQGFNDVQIDSFDFMLHEIFLNTRKYQAMALGFLEDNPESIRANLLAAIEKVIKMELSNEIPENQKISLLIEQTPEFSVITVFSPYITDEKIDRVLDSVTLSAREDAHVTHNRMEGQAEVTGLGVSLIIKMLNADFPESFYITFNEPNGRGFTRLILKKPQTQGQSANQTELAS